MTTPKEALRAVRTWTNRRQRIALAAQEAQEAQADAIREAITAGVTTAELIATTGLSQGRIYQIRDRRRNKWPAKEGTIP
jgi:uncharacterized protein YggE